jgi:hypothetical protein
LTKPSCENLCLFRVDAGAGHFLFRCCARAGRSFATPSTNAQIIWKAPTNNLPKSFWIYKKLPRVFSAAVISNALMLASFQSKELLRRHPARRSLEFSLRRIAA